MGSKFWELLTLLDAPYDWNDADVDDSDFIAHIAEQVEDANTEEAERMAEWDEKQTQANEDFIAFWNALQAGNVTPQADVPAGYWDVD